ncbi:hypothetical protein BdWA1_000281 [Babesia duncani]|uniref:Uncharacterized protein n=1 Tax=Babesia duncani TaxID=323732 RepID=A0AAD9PMT1_9APIC|nr:hypothetical protein BdWA1_000281 [Babesia duncani]
MDRHQDESSSEEEPETTSSGLDIEKVLKSLLLSGKFLFSMHYPVAEKLTKICVVCEGRSVADAVTVKGLVKNMQVSN